MYCIKVYINTFTLPFYFLKLMCFALQNLFVLFHLCSQGYLDLLEHLTGEVKEVYCEICANKTGNILINCESILWNI